MNANTFERATDPAADACVDSGIHHQSNEGEAPVRLHQSADDLRHLATKMESFLLQQLDRLEREIVAASNGADEGDTDQLMLEFQAVRQAWEVEKTAEKERIEDDSVKLAEAWERLENEQRELLKQRASQKTVTTTAKVSGSPAHGERSRPQSNAAAKKSPATSGSPTTVAGHKNQLQFQQLRREMLEHARQRRKR